MNFSVNKIRLWLALLALTCCLLGGSGVASAQAVKRIVVIKVDGLAYDLISSAVAQRNPATGKSILPWTEEVFYRRGTRMENFYVRGMSLSAPSWSLLDTGQHLFIKGNVEFDRFTLQSYDFLNFIPYYISTVTNYRVDMPGVEVLDDVRHPLLIDAFAYDERQTAFQLYQRGNRWSTILRAMTNFATENPPRDVLDEWTVGITGRSLIETQYEREIIEKLKDPHVKYLDIYLTELDHVSHHNRDAASKLDVLVKLDALIGRIWTAIQESPEGRSTALALVSDHGFNSDPNIYSQGFNIVKLLAGAEGGGHHVITKRRLLLDYSLKGFYPLVPIITTTTKDSYYLQHQSADYPTAMVDFDGNERSSLHLRNSHLNLLHILWQQAQRRDLNAQRRQAVQDAFFKVLNERRPVWQQTLTEVNEELAELRKEIERKTVNAAALPTKFTQEDSDTGRDKAVFRFRAELDRMRTDEQSYGEYVRTLANLLQLRPDVADILRKVKIEEIIAKHAMGEQNTLAELETYVLGVARNGLQFDAGGRLDMERSFQRINYFKLLRAQQVRNNPQPQVSNRPIDFVAARVGLEEFGDTLDQFGKLDEDVIWLYGDEDKQGLILSRTDESGKLWLRYVPAARLRANELTGKLIFDRADLRADLPLQYLEDENFAASNRREFLSTWHTDEDWLRATHRTRYSNGIIGLHEQLARHITEATDFRAQGISDSERLQRRFLARQRRMTEADLLLLANNHWNFDVRGFNPGGNHGSFFRAATHSTLMFAGGALTGIPQGKVVAEPFDSLSFMPTVLSLMGEVKPDDGTLQPVLWQKGFRPFPGKVIREVVNPPSSLPAVAISPE